MKKLNLFEFDNVSYDLLKLKKEKKELLRVFNIIRKILFILKTLNIIVIFLIMINENLSVFKSILWIFVLFLITIVFFSFCDGVEEKIEKIRRTLK